MNTLKHYLLVIAISAFPFISLFTTPLAPHTHDSPVHYARMAAYYKALSEGQILPRWAGELNYGYGMPLFNFIYHVPYLASSLFIFLGAGLVLSFKISLLVCFLLSGVFMYRFALHLFKDENHALLTTLLYQFAPFHLVDLFVRGDLAEGFALAFLPFLLGSITKIFDEKRPGVSDVLMTAFASVLLILSHNSMSLIFFGIAFLYAVVFAPVIRKKILALAGMGLGVGMTAFYWLPAVIERKFTYGDLFMKDMYLSHFAPLSHFFIPNLTNSDRFQTGGIAVSFGLVQTIALLLCIALLLTKRITNKPESRIAAFALFLFCGALFFMQPISKIFWAGIPVLRMFQFPWRFLNVAVFALSLLGPVLFMRKKIPMLVLVLICAITLLSVSVYFRPPLGFDAINERYYWNYPLNTTYFGETDVIWSAGPAGSYPQNRFEVISGTGSIRNTVKKGTYHSFTVTADTDVTVVDKTQYFPGWRVYDGTAKIPIEFQDQNWRGLITFQLPKGTHEIRVVWEDSPLRKAAETISVITLITVICILSARKKIEHQL